MNGIARHVSGWLHRSRLGLAAPTIQSPVMSSELVPVKYRFFVEGPRFENMVTFFGVIVVSVCALADDALSTSDIHRAAATMNCFAIGCFRTSVDRDIRTVEFS